MGEENKEKESLKRKHDEIKGWVFKHWSCSKQPASSDEMEASNASYSTFFKQTFHQSIESQISNPESSAEDNERGCSSGYDDTVWPVGLEI